MKYPDIEHKTLGELRYNSELEWYEGRVPFQESLISISLSTDDQGDVTSSLERAVEVTASMETYAEKARGYAAERLLGLKNESWLDEGEAQVTADQFERLMKLESIVFESDGGATFYHDDGDLFWGHSIQVTMSSEDRFIDADIPGEPVVG